MNKILLLGTAAMAMVAVSACSSQEAEDLNNNTADKATITAVIASTSRTYAEDGGTATWAKGDQFYALSTGHIYTNNDDDNAASATFTSDASDAETSEYAVYPYFEGKEPSLSGSDLTVTLPTEYTYTVTDNTFNANTNAPMLGKLSGSTYTFQHLVGVLRLQYPSLPAGTKSVKFEANVRITGAYTTTIAAHELKQDTETTGNAVTINLSEATTAAVENARFIIPLPTGSYAGFKVSAIDADGTVISSYTTYKTYELKLGNIALFGLNNGTSGDNVVTLDASSTSPSSGTWEFGNGWILTSTKDYTASNGYIKAGKATHTLTIPSTKKVTKVTIVGCPSSDGKTSYISSLTANLSSNESFSKEFSATDYVMPKKGTYVYTTFVLPEAATGSLSFGIGTTQSLIKVYLTCVDAE